MTDNTLIKLDAITKVFLTDEIETHALSGIHLEILKGEFVSISGPSGCGKSTLLSILGLLEAPSDGHYILNGRNVSRLTLEERARIRNREIGFIFQSFNLIGDLNVIENVELPLAYRGLGQAERRKMATAARQRVAVARALAGNPKILLADEPTGNLDSKNGTVVMDMLSELNAEGTTICMVTHDDRYAHIANRIVRLFDGKIVDDLRENRAVARAEA